MKLFATLILLLSAAVAAQSQAALCGESAFSGEATQGEKYSQLLGEHFTFSVEPMRARDDPRWAWFQIRVIPDDWDGFVFNINDTNWLLAASFGSAFIGGPNVDLNAALHYSARQLAFPASGDDKTKALDAVSLIATAKTPEELRQSLSAMKMVSLVQVQFTITDYELGAGIPPMSVERVNFNVKFTFPPGFGFSAEIPITFVPCPAIPHELFENIRNPKRHRYLLASDNDLKGNSLRQSE